MSWRNTGGANRSALSQLLTRGQLVCMRWPGKEVSWRGVVAWADFPGMDATIYNLSTQEHQLVPRVCLGRTRIDALSDQELAALAEWRLAHG